MKFNFAAHIISQKMRVRAQSACDVEYITPGGGVVTLSNAIRPVRESAAIMDEIDNLPGLNTRERSFAGGPTRREYAFA